jgi:Sulfatase
MKILTHPAMLALGTTTLCLLPLIGPFVAPSHLPLYHLAGSSAPLVLSILLNVFVLWLMLTGLFVWAQRPGWPRIFIWSSLTLSTPWILLKVYALMAPWPMPHGLSVSIFAGCMMALISVLFLLRRRPAFLVLFERTQHFIATLLGFVALSGLLVLGQMLWFAWRARSFNVPRPLHQGQTASSMQHPRTRVIWVLLDELSYQQVYEQRFPGLKLDAFDQLAAQSTVFTHVIPAAGFTEIAVPSLITGIPVDRVSSSSSSGLLSLHNARTNSWQPFDPHQTIFQDALTAGYSTGVVGWYNLYCRILPSVLDRCFWTDHIVSVEPGLYVGQSFAKALLAPTFRFYDATKSLFRGRTRDDRYADLDAKFHIADYKDLSKGTDRLLEEPSISFTFLHLPVPHPGGIYDRKTSSFTTHNASYVDNLALADKSFAHLRHMLEQNGTWDSSAIVVMGDHSWRTTLLWTGSFAWTPEDEAASHGGQFDDRPAYIVKLPNQHQSARVDDRFDAVRTRALLDGIITNRIKTPEDLATWVRQQN